MSDWTPELDAVLAEQTDDDTLVALEAAAQRARDVSSKVYQFRIADEAHRIIARERRADRPPPRLVNLADFLATASDLPTYRIDKLLPTGGRVLLPAGFKAGKTTMSANFLRSLVDGEPFLDTFDVRQASHVVLIDNELDENMLRSWLSDHDIANPQAISLVSMRGNVSSFDLLDEETRAYWAKALAGAEVLVIDCLRPILDALGLDENHEVGRFLVALDALLLDIGGCECVLVHHMGHTNERSRGDSRLNDWPDAIWKLVRDKDDENPDMDDVDGARYFSAYGRDVNYPQSELTYDQETRRLSLGDHAPNRKQATAKRNSRRADEAVMKAISSKPGITKRFLREAALQLGATGHQDIDNAVERLVERGLIWRQKQGAAQLHWPSRADSESDTLDSVPNVPRCAEIDLGTPAAEEGASVPVRHPPLGTYKPPPSVPNLLDESGELGTPETKTCPDCGAAIPEHHTRCAPCVMAFIEARKSGADPREDQA